MAFDLHLHLAKRLAEQGFTGAITFHVSRPFARRILIELPDISSEIRGPDDIEKVEPVGWGDVSVRFRLDERLRHDGYRIEEDREPPAAPPSLL